jgi:CubicO group peptidase (beta-lactamase class C family)
MESPFMPSLKIIKWIPTLSASAVMGFCAVASDPAVAQQWPNYSTLLDGNVLPDTEVAMLSHSDKLFPVNAVYRKGPVHPLGSAPKKLGPITFSSGGKEYDLFDYLASNRVAGLLVLKDGTIAFEDYELGTGPTTLWASFSMAKSVTSTLLAVALKRGLIKSVDDSVTGYVPALKGGGYDEVSVRNVLQMASGIKWNETYTDPNSDTRKVAALRSQLKPGVILAYMKGLPRKAAPGTVWNYNTGETFVAGAVVEGATHEPLAKFLTETIWSRLGMEQDATWWLESPGGMAYAGAGIGATLRDYGRFALMVQNDGVIDGESIVPDGWFREAGSPHTIGDKVVGYGYQWWTTTGSADPVHQGAFEAAGIFGQYMYINPREKVVIVVLSARPKPTGTALDDQAFFASVVKALR